MMQKKNRKFLEFAGCMLLAVMVYMVIYKFIPIVYSTNDDRMIAELVSGQFTGKPESYGIQMTYGYTWFLSKLYEITRELNWYGIVLISVQMFSFGAVLYRLQSFSENEKNKAVILAAAVFAFVGIWLKVYVQLTYTTTAAFVGMAAIFWYAASKTNWKNLLMTAILANIAFSIRPNVFYMLVPATGIVYLWKIFGKQDFKKLTIGAPFMILAVTACLFVVNAAAYSQEGWKEFREFFDVRTEVFDYYDLLPYNEYPQLYEPYGISEEEFNMMRVYNYTVTGDLPKEFFPEYIEACKNMEETNDITSAVKIFVKDLFTNGYGLSNTLLFAVALILLIWLIIKNNYLLALYLGIQSTVICAVWLYFTYWGRTIERIQVTMSLIFLAVILHVICEIKEMFIYRNVKLAKVNRFSRVLFGILVFAAASLAGTQFVKFRADNIEKTYWYQDVQTIKEYCAKDPDRLYFMDIATMTELYGKCTIRNTEPDYINYICMGDWTAYCPHYEEKLVRHGVENVAESITDENTYVIILHNFQVQCMKDYLGVEEEWVETIFGAHEVPYAVYQFH